MRIEMFLVKTPISSITIKQQPLTLDHWVCPQKTVVDLKKQQVKKKTKWDYKKTLLPPFMDGVQLLQD